MTKRSCVLYKSAVLSCVLAASVLGALGGGARASEVEITISGLYDPTTVFDVAQNPTPSVYNDGTSFSLYGIAVLVNGGPAMDFVYFYNANASNGLDFVDGLSYVDTGPQLYTGPESSPTFVLGQYSAYDTNGGAEDTITISNVSAAPEPSTWAMLMLGFAGLGFAGLGFAAHRRASSSRMTAAASA